jgi:hypothetical protein
MLRIEMLPAEHGDAIWVEYGSTTTPHRMLIDGGPINAYAAVHKRLAAATSERKDIDLFVITHIDTDHIDGAVLLLRDELLKIEFRDIWFNAWEQLAPEPLPGDTYGPEQGEFVSALINLKQHPWNRAFNRRAAVIGDTDPLPIVPLAGGAKLTLLSPGDRQLRRLRRNWSSVIADAGWTPGDAAASLKRLENRQEYRPELRRDTFAGEVFGTDNAVANGSTIAFILEFEGKRCLFAGDAFPDVLADGLSRYAALNGIEGRIALDALKVPHHGSAKNWSPELQSRLTAKNFLISTSGARFKHPDRETIDQILKDEPDPEVRLWFNYKSATTERWQNPTGSSQSRYKAIYAEDKQSITVNLE